MPAKGATASNATRTTLIIGDGALEAARKLATTHHQPLGRVVSKLMCRRLVARTTYSQQDNGLPVFKTAKDSRPITLEDVKRDENEP